MVSIKSFYSSQINFHTFKSQMSTESREMKTLPKLSSLQDKQSVNLMFIGPCIIFIVE